jgi:hypothetical protein
VLGALSARGERLADDLADALQLHRRVRRSGITLEPRGNNAHLIEWESALTRFAARTGEVF